MKSLLPQTPNFRYERMLAAATVSAICLVLAVQFGIWFLQVAGTPLKLLLLPPKRETVRAVAFALASSSFLILGVAYTLLTANKMEVFTRANCRRYFFSLRLIGVRLIWTGLAVALLWLMAGAVVEFWA